MTTKSHYSGSSEGPRERSLYATGGDGKYETSQDVTRMKWNDYYHQYIECNRSPGSSPQYIGDVWWSGNRFPVSNLSPNDILTAQSRLSESVKGHQFNLAVSAAEGGKTVEMVTKAVTSISGAVRDLKRGKFESAARRLGVSPRPTKNHLTKNDVAGRWLELQYGWLPLINDVYEASKAYEAITQPPRRTRVVASVTSRSTGDASNSPSLYSVKGNMKEGFRIIYEMTEEISTARSLGLTNPASVVWELIPYSFVLDWFIPIGDYLDVLNVIPQLRGRFCTTQYMRFQGSSSNVSSSGVTYTAEPQCATKAVYTLRTISSSLSVPKPEFKTLPEAMSPKRIFNAIALGVQRMR